MWLNVIYAMLTQNNAGAAPSSPPPPSRQAECKGLQGGVRSYSSVVEVNSFSHALYLF